MIIRRKTWKVVELPTLERITELRDPEVRSSHCVVSRQKYWRVLNRWHNVRTIQSNGTAWQLVHNPDGHDDRWYARGRRTVCRIRAYDIKWQLLVAERRVIGCVDSQTVGLTGSLFRALPDCGTE